ncbi:MAG TPA: hypothetical protein VF846_12835, partial [Thermoanaerobaculia bacterium]
MSTPKSKVLCTLAVCAIVIGASRADAAPVTLAQVIKQVQEQQKRTSTLQADFRQEKELALMAKPEVSTGTFT